MAKLLLVMVNSALVLAAVFMPIIPPAVTVTALLNRLIFFIMLLSNSIAEPTDVPMDIPVKAVLVAVEDESTWILFGAAPAPLLPTILLLTLEGAVVLFI